MAALRSLVNSLLNGRNIVLGHGAAKDIVHKLEAAAPHHWFDTNDAITELPMTAGLLFVAAARLGGNSNRLAIRHLGRLERDLGVISLAQFRDDHLDVLLARSRNQEFVGLRVAVEAN